MNLGRSSLGPNLGTNLPATNGDQRVNGAVVGRMMPQVKTPCDLQGPLVRGSNWPVEVIIYPHAARPLYARTINLYQEVEITTAGIWVSVVTISTENGEEGRIQEMAGEEEGAVGSDLSWRIILDGSSPGDYDVMRGGWSAISQPAKIVTPVPANASVSLQVMLPAGSPTPRTVRAMLRGWLAPYDGGGTFAGGFAR